MIRDLLPICPVGAGVNHFFTLVILAPFNNDQVVVGVDVNSYLGPTTLAPEGCPLCPLRMHFIMVIIENYFPMITPNTLAPATKDSFHLHTST